MLEAVRAGDLDASVIDLSVRRIAGLDARRGSRTAGVDLDAHHALARELAAECAVLLRNEHDTLPLRGGVRIAVLGALAEHPRIQGGGSAHVNAYRVDVPVEEIRAVAAAHGSAVAYATGYRLDEPGSEELVAEAVAAARQCDVAVVFAGLSERWESEGVDRDSLDLPAEQVELIRAVAGVAPRTVVVLSNGGVVSLEPWHDDVDAVLEAFVLGQGGGRAIAELLLGVRNPSGHLAETIPVRLHDHASSLNFPGEQGHVRYGEGIFVGYRQFSTFGTPVRYPFGHGLSYTTFVTRSVSARVTGPDSVTVEVEVENTGGREGKHVVQVYVATTAGPVRRPVRELRAFTKIELSPGQRETVRFELGRRAFAYWDIDAGAWVVAPGTYEVQVGPDAHTVEVTASVELAGEIVAREVTLDSTIGAWLEHPVISAPTLQALGFADATISEEHMAMVRSMTMRQFITISGLDLPVERLQELAATSRTH
ncbi:glycoside hydrolase family 3 C-terminal domain-containing protein [[Actinomadura] parvosata]|uniref:glycoside hydrolase family 3 C-terminal domain-containing protein n=1 Tax=[Actinomadura] parvosata TaxID=1955412 RepID=UPI001FEBB21E